MVWNQQAQIQDTVIAKEEDLLSLTLYPSLSLMTMRVQSLSSLLGKGQQLETFVVIAKVTMMKLAFFDDDFHF